MISAPVTLGGDRTSELIPLFFPPSKLRGAQFKTLEFVGTRKGAERIGLSNVNQRARILSDQSDVPE